MGQHHHGHHHGHGHRHTDFDAVAATWDDESKVARARAIAAGIAAAIPLDGVRVALEYGSGTGLVTWALAGALPGDARVILADLSQGMLAVLRERIADRPEADRHRFEARALDLTADTLPEHSLDLAYASMSLHHVTDVPLVLGRLRAALRPGGHLAVADLDADHAGDFHGDDFAGHHGFDRDALAAQIVAAGFTPPAFTDVATVTKPVDGVDKDFPVFLAVSTVS